MATAVRRLLDRAAHHNPLPPGALTVAAGYAINGVCAYGFLVVSARALGADRYTPLSVLWALVFVAAPGLFLPLEQEVGRALAARRVHGVGGRPVIERAAAAGAVLAVVVVVAALAAHRPLVDGLFERDGLLLIGFCVAIAVYSGYFLARGALAGNGRFGPYARLIVVEGLTRVAAVVGLDLAGVRAPGAYGLAIGLPCLVGIAAGLRGQRGLARPGPHSAWSELSTALGWLLAGWVLAQVLVNIGPLTVKVLSPSGDPAAGRFLNGLVIARIPLFFFQAVLASLLPRLAAQVAAGHIAEFRAGFRRLLAALVVITAVATAAYFALGPLALRVLFGSGYELGHLDVALLAAASGIYMLALAMAQALLALGGHSRVAWGWLAGLLVFAVLLPLGGALLLRVEVALVAASVAATAAMGALLARRLAVRERSGDAMFAAAGPMA